MAIMPCSCASVFQDREYGEGQRLFNAGKDNEIFRCTVCRRSTGEGGGPAPKKEKK